MATLDGLRGFDLADPNVAVWVFKKSGGSLDPVFTGKWIEITAALRDRLMTALRDSIAAATETQPYNLLAENNVSSVLTLAGDETHLARAADQTADPIEKKKATKVKELENAAFYMVRATTDAGVLLAFRKTDPSWRARRASGYVRAVFTHATLDVDDRPAFHIDNRFDFFVLDGSLFIANKPGFESVLEYRTGHVEEFGKLVAEPEFAAIFSDMAPIAAYVGTNKIQLRRALTIREKAHYKDDGFMTRLRAEYVRMKLNIQFDAAGLIIPTGETCSDIFKAFLDHRLDSRLTQELFDVQNSEKV